MRLELSGMVKHYRGVRALTEANLQLRRGEIMALLGENGAGKSTIVKIISGLIQPDDGVILLDGEKVDFRTSKRSQEAGVAVVQQEFSTVRTMSVAENMMLGRADSGRLWSPRRLRRDARAQLDLVGLDHVDPRTRVEDLTVAEMQLLEIAKVLARDARILIFDEPTAVLSDSEIDWLLSVVKRVAEEGRSVIYVTHRLPEVFRICDRVTVFRAGTSLDPVAVSELDPDSIVTMMLGRELETMFPDREPPSEEVLMEVENFQVGDLAEPVSFKVHAGEIVGMVGQRGSGADSVVQGLAGRLPAPIGSVTVAGEQVSLKSRGEGIRRGIAYCSADRKKDGTFQGISTQKNLSSPWLGRVSRRGWVSAGAERELARKSAERFAIDLKRLPSPVGALSGGNQQKVALGKWVGTSPNVLLVEEPTRGVDVGARAEIYAELRGLCREGMGIILSSSDTSEVLGLSDTIGTFYRGRLTAIAQYEHWTEDALARQVMHSEGVA